MTHVAAHHTIRKLKGKASAYDCVQCGGQAMDWAYVHGPDTYGLREFSLDLDDYVPMCKACHRKYDAPPEVFAELGRRGGAVSGPKNASR